MSTIIRVAGADFSANAVGFLPPVANGLAGWFMLGGTIDQSVRNLAQGGANAAAVGSPGVSSGYCSFDGNTPSYLQTSIAETQDMTYIIAMRSGDTFADGTHAPAPIGTFQSGQTPIGLGLLFLNGTLPTVQLRLYAGQDAVTSGTTSLNVTDPDTWKFFAAVVESGAHRDIHNLTDNTGATAVPGARVDAGISSRIVRVGSSYGGNRGISDIAFAAVYTRALSAGELAAIYAFVQPILSARGVDA